MTCCKWEKTVPVPNIWETEVSASQSGFSSCISVTWMPDRCRLASSIPYITKVHPYDVINIVNILIHLFQGLRMPHIMKRSRSGCLSSDLLQLFLILKTVKELKHLLFLMVPQEHLKRASMVCRKRLHFGKLIMISHKINNTRQDMRGFALLQQNIK